MKLRYQGFIAMDYTSRYGEAAVYLADLVSRGKMAYEYTILSGEAGQNGLGRCVEGMDVVSSGRNVGKTSVWLLPLRKRADCRIIKIGAEEGGRDKARL